MKKLIFELVLLAMCISSFGYAQEANSAFFSIIEEENTVEIEAVIPSVIREAILAYYPKMENFDNPEDYGAALFAYLDNHLKLYDTGGKQMDLQTVDRTQSDSYPNQNNYRLVYDGNGLQEVSNSILFELDAKQKNYHSILIDDKTLEHTTTEQAEDFTVNITNDYVKSYWWLMLFPLVIMTIPIFSNLKHQNR